MSLIVCKQIDHVTFVAMVIMLYMLVLTLHLIVCSATLVGFKSPLMS